MKNKIKILIVEDEIMFAQWLKVALEDEGYKVYDFITTGEEAIAFVQENKPDVILMDILLVGKINGIDTAKEITDKFNIPIIFMTGYEEPAVIERAKKIKPVAYLNKPLEIWDIIPVIESIFK